MSGAGLPCIPQATTDLVYVRMHGPDPDSMYAGSYPEKDLRWWAGLIAEWDNDDRDVWMYFNNDPLGHAVRDALLLRGLLS
jgi:uncharacterized protein YecE (DUF72 family)